MDLSMVENMFRRTVLVGVLVTVVMGGMLCLKIVKAPKRPARAQSTPVPTPASLDVPERDSDQQMVAEKLPLTGYVPFYKRAQP